MELLEIASQARTLPRPKSIGRGFGVSGESQPETSAFTKDAAGRGQIAQNSKDRHQIRPHCGKL